MASKRNIWLWALYDFANSIITIVFFLYFAQWVIIDKGIPDLKYNLIFTASAVLLLLTVPVTGFLLDKYWRRITGLRITTVLTIIFHGICAVAALNDHVILALIFNMFGLYVYLLSFTFYTPLINDIVEPAKRGKISGLGVAANYCGQIVGLLIALPFATGAVSFFNAAPRVEVLLPSIILFAILALPMLILFKEPKREFVGTPDRRDFRELFLKSKAVFLYPSVGLFILSYFLFNDAVLTAANNFPVFMQQVWGLSDTVKTYVMLGILVTSAIGGIVSGIIADKFGHKKTLMWIISGWICILPAVGLATNFTLFCILTTCMGLWFGAMWAVSRSVMSYLAPEHNKNLTFAYFGLVERASSLVGPIVWGVILGQLVHLGAIRYRYATVAVSVFIVLGFLALIKVRSDREKKMV